jgi:dihydrofolate reductase
MTITPLEDFSHAQADQFRLHLAGRRHYGPKLLGAPYPDAINAIRKYVFSSTLESADWNNSTLIRDDVVTAVKHIKEQGGGDLMMYGYGRLSQTLLEHHLVDEIRFSIHPVLAGGGNGQTLPLKLVEATPSPKGVVALTYTPA